MRQSEKSGLETGDRCDGVTWTMFHGHVLPILTFSRCSRGHVATCPGGPQAPRENMPSHPAG